VTTQLSAVELTESVRATWASVLRRPTVGDDDDFFRLGGDSLAAVSICSRLEELLGVRPTLRMLIDHPRLADYTGRVTTLVAGES